MLRVTEPVEVLFCIGGTFHLRGKTEGSFKPTLKVNRNSENSHSPPASDPPNVEKGKKKGVGEFKYELSLRKFLKPKTELTCGYDAQLVFISRFSNAKFSCSDLRPLL